MAIGLTVVKQAVVIASELGVGTIVGGACKAYIPEAAGTATKVCAAIGTMGIAGAVGAATDKWWADTIDSIDTTVKKIKAIKKEPKVVEVDGVEIVEEEA